jgi:hypothetical protein
MAFGDRADSNVGPVSYCRISQLAAGRFSETFVDFRQLDLSL